VIYYFSFAVRVFFLEPAKLQNLIIIESRKNNFPELAVFAIAGFKFVIHRSRFFTKLLFYDLLYLR